MSLPFSARPLGERVKSFPIPPFLPFFFLSARTLSFSLSFFNFPSRRRLWEDSIGVSDFRNASSSRHFVETCRQLHRRARAVESSDDFPLRCWVFLDSLPLRGEILLRHGPLRISLLYLPWLWLRLDAWRRIKKRESAGLVSMPGCDTIWQNVTILTGGVWRFRSPYLFPLTWFQWLANSLI